MLVGDLLWWKLASVTHVIRGVLRGVWYSLLKRGGAYATALLCLLLNCP